ncbi:MULTISPECIES: NAD(P)/FAD-dependent oxidoreductase [unclassified Rhizobium]|uniref:NAD(P)/FAD-dependent oxidoreductase n=1 Tax=unclassified Rhizobium TaxID=2613769 RepID=UPI0007124BEE|nr:MULTISPECIES: FAD-dependent oxidoreductase [unclassified Rhizobium]KQS99222.1 D-amino acid oxidase [Rhizobium sp. Leaf386]KQT05304.1 D-amino acid oxidase [Rhizobium sp. Leaf391]KQT91746.1 D-amino acid oxidase [Rhizobium sp. Leaf453]
MTDLLIVGGGIMGLWAAVMAERAGLKTVLIEKDRIGAGASGGVVGALMPHMPDRWNGKKRFQFDALVALEAEIAALEAQTGLSAGYRRSGRLIPLPKPHLRTIALRHEQDALANWRVGDRQFFWHVRDDATPAGWPQSETMASGVVLDTLAGRVDPRRMLALLLAYLRQSNLVRIEEGRELLNLDLVKGQAILSGGETLSFGSCVLAAGVQSFGHLDRLETAAAEPTGVAVKGQAALLEADIDPALPVIFFDGLYVIPHDNGLVAVGSTSENSFSDPRSTDGQLEDLLDHARTIVPLLRDAPVVERWAGLRPKAIGRDPMVGRHPDFEKLYILTGGFKISFGLAHRLAESVIGEICGRPDKGLPQSFRCQEHFSLVRGT